MKKLGIVLALIVACPLAYAHDDNQQGSKQICITLPNPECGCGLEPLVVEEPPVVCLPAPPKDDKDK